MRTIKPLTLIEETLKVPKEERDHYLRVAEQFPDDDSCWRVALFHDLVEDGYISIPELTCQADLKVYEVAAIEAITRKESERYFDYIARLKQNEIARKVKLADLTDNIKRCSGNLPERWGLLRRYAKAYGILIDQWKEYNGEGK